MNEGAERGKQGEEATKEEGIVEGVSFGEVERELRKIKAEKAVGPDQIPVEVWKIVGEKAIFWLQRLFNRMLAGEEMPRE